MKIHFIIFTILLSLSLSQGTLAATNIGIPMDAGTLIEIESYDATTQTYAIKDVQNYGQGPWFTTAGQLVYAVSSLKLDRVQKDPESVVSNQYKTDRLLLLITQDVVDVLGHKTARRSK